MNKKRLLVFIFSLAIMICFSSIVSFAANSYSFDFEKAKTGSITDFSTYDYEAEYNSNYDATSFEIVEGYSGNSLKITNNQANDSRVYRTISVSKNSYYEISYYLKTENVEGGNGANVSGYNCTGYSGVTSGTTDWHKVTLYLKTGDKQKSIDISFGLGGYGNVATGTAWFDDITITKLSKAPTEETFEITEIASSSSSTSSSTGVNNWFKLIFAIVVIGSVYYCGHLIIKSDKYKLKNGLTLSEDKSRLDKKDLIIIVAMTIITAVISFVNLGSLSGTPNTYWQSGHAGEYIEISFDEESQVDRFVYFTGIARGSGNIQVEYLNENGDFSSFATIKSDDITFYKWHTVNTNFKAKTIRVYVNNPGLWINEMGFFEEDEDGNLVQISVDTESAVTNFEETSNSGVPTNLFDEQEDVCSEINMMNSTYFDEIYFPRTAYESINGLSIYERTHPPLGKNLMALGVLIFGMNTFGWRFMGTLFGVLMVPLMYLFGKKVFKKKEWAFAVAFLMMFDCMRLAQTRLATIDSYSCFFAIAMYYFMYDYFMCKSYDLRFTKSLKPLIFCGIMFGLGASSKWTCLYAGAGLAIVFFASKICELRDIKAGKGFVKQGDKNIHISNTKDYLIKNFLPTCLACVVFFIIVPATIYILNYIPYMASNQGKSLIQVVIDNQKYMYNYHSGLTAEHSFGSKWYTWPIMGRPIWYYVNNNVASGMRSTIVSIGNPAIWWVGIPCVFAGMIFAWKNNDKKMGLLLIAYVLQYAPWILVSRVCFIYHYFTAFPFTIFFIVYVLKELLEKKIIKKWVVWIYLAVVLLLFIMFYPALTGMTVSAKYIESLRWFSSWYF